VKRLPILVVNLLILVCVLPSVFVKAAADGTFSGPMDVAQVAPNPVVETNSTSLIVLVLVNSTIYGGVEASLMRYRADLVGFGFEDVKVLNWSEPNPALIRGTLQDFYLNSSLAGVLLVGDLPAAEYEMFTEWDYERFPMDLYYMDLDGNWTDSDRDGILDTHSGRKVAPEIWVGRIKASNLGEDEVSLVNNYFARNHQYRSGLLSVPKRALMYIDDDWADYATMDSYSLGLLYDNVTEVFDKRTTSVADFKERLNQGYEWIHLRAHGDWKQTGFLVPGESGGLIYSTEYKALNPQALFYQLFVCYAARFTEPNYLAGEIVFNTDSALMAISSTKLGGMLMYWTFYEALANGKTVGDAFKEWFVKWGEGKLSISSNWIGRKWFYGLTVIGDPTLRLRWLGEKEIADLQRREEEVIDDLPLVQGLFEQIENSESSYDSLNAQYNNLKDSHLALRLTYDGVIVQLGDIRDLVYFFLLVVGGLAVSNVYLVRTRPKPKRLNLD